MQKTVPFQKDITFNDNIAEINSIALEHKLISKSDSQITGKFIINGDYKLTQTSSSLDNFEYELPFNISIDDKYDITNSSIDISDFYYEVVNNKILSVNIELTIDNISEKEEPMEIEDKEETEEITETKEEKNQQHQETSDNEERCVEEENTITDIFSSFDDGEKYITYKIHVVTENDTIESIISDYQTTKEKLDEYNDITEIKTGDKIIVPTNED